MMNSAFYFILKAFFVLVIFAFLSWLFRYVEKRLDKKTMVNFKIYDVTAGQQIITIHILPNISELKAIRQWNLVS